ncbi:glycine--tRNA ligase [Candidatus Dependentiae bacterium]|nr:glycine--tRNA ligase [Candidatus Dependentiae bacterium]
MATLEQIVSLCKRRGFVFQSAEIYGGLNGVYDFGPLGVLLKQNIKNFWMDHVAKAEFDVVFFDGALLGHEMTWTASGHVSNFSDPLVDCKNCKKRYRADDDDYNAEKPCKSCGVKNWTEERRFNLMFQTNMGAMTGDSIAYLRPETAQAVFVNFKNVMTSSRTSIPFGIAQIGKAFRNEITPKQFLFRMREFEQMELEFFCHPSTSNTFFETWCKIRNDFYQKIGLNMSKIRQRPHANDELAHYSQACVDMEYEFPFGFKELEGIAHRGDFDLKQHSQFSKKDLSVHDQQAGTSYLPHVVECSVGVDRLFLTMLFDAYTEDVVDGEPRVFLNFAPHMAPIRCAVFPLTKHQGELAGKIFADLKKKFAFVQYDDGGSIGKRYRRQDEIGTPFCITIDYQSAEDGAVTVRERNSGSQERIAITELVEYLAAKLAQ